MKRKLVFLFMSKSSATAFSTKRVIPTKACGEQYIRDFRGECYFKMLEELLRLGIFDELNIFYESNIKPGLADWIEDKSLQNKVYCEVIPEIRFVEDYIDDNTVIFVRGGFKHWYDFLRKYKNKNWLMIYAANTGREKWSFWDIILNDISLNNNFVDTNERYWFKFIKPTNEDIFFFKNNNPTIDICIGASHIHDRKGQYHVIDAIRFIEENYNHGVRALLPGSSRGGIYTSEMFKNIHKINSVEYIGYVNKKELNNIFNSSKLFIHMGNHGQNDRSVLEAFASGTPVIYKSNMHHDPELRKYCHQFIRGDDPEALAKIIKSRLNKWKQSDKNNTYQNYKHYFGFNEVVIPRMSKLFDFMFSYKPNKTSKTVLTKIFKGQSCDL